jgi:hypothetical protein
MMLNYVMSMAWLNIFFRQQGTDNELNLSAGRNIDFNLDNNQLEVGVLYDIVVIAINSIGEGPPSEASEFMRVERMSISSYQNIAT